MLLKNSAATGTAATGGIRTMMVSLSLKNSTAAYFEASLGSLARIAGPIRGQRNRHFPSVMLPG